METLQLETNSPASCVQAPELGQEILEESVSGLPPSSQAWSLVNHSLALSLPVPGLQVHQLLGTAPSNKRKTVSRRGLEIGQEKEACV